MMLNLLHAALEARAEHLGIRVSRVGMHALKKRNHEAPGRLPQETRKSYVPAGLSMVRFALTPGEQIWVVVKIMVLFGVPIIIQPLIFRVP